MTNFGKLLALLIAVTAATLGLAAVVMALSTLLSVTGLILFAAVAVVSVGAGGLMFGYGYGVLTISQRLKGLSPTTTPQPMQLAGPNALDMPPNLPAQIEATNQVLLDVFLNDEFQL